MREKYSYLQDEQNLLKREEKSLQDRVIHPLNKFQMKIMEANIEQNEKINKLKQDRINKKQEERKEIDVLEMDKIQVQIDEVTNFPNSEG